MFELSISKEDLLTPLLTVAAAVDKKQSLAILSNILLVLKDNRLQLTATDLEIEISASLSCVNAKNEGRITVPAKKMLDIIRSLEDNAAPSLSFDAGTLCIKEGRSRFKLATLAADNYPASADEPSEIELNLSKSVLLHLLQSTHFAMSQQDLRFFLNGLLLELDARFLTAVATDGHRMAIARYASPDASTGRYLVPRKAVQEMMRLLANIDDENICLSIGKNHIKLSTRQYTLFSKLLETRYPPYAQLIPKDQDKQILIDRDLLRRALNRTVVLANEKSRAVVLHMQEGILTLIANNQEQEEAVESIEAETEGEELKIGINSSYLLDVLSQIPEGKVRLSLSNMNSSILVESLQDELYQYIIMPMKI